MPALILVSFFKDDFDLVEVDINLGVLWFNGIKEIKVKLIFLGFRNWETDMNGLFGEILFKKVLIFEGVLDFDSNFSHSLVPLELNFLLSGWCEFLVRFVLRLILDINNLDRLLLEN